MGVNVNTQTISLDVSKRPNIAPVVRVGRGDVDGLNLVVNVLDHGDAMTVSSYDASLLIRLGGTLHEIPGETSGSHAAFTVDSQGMKPGRTRNAYVSIDGGSFVLSTERFEFEVLSSAEG